MKLSFADTRLDLFREICRKNKLKVTPQRLAVYEALLKSKDHPSAEIVLERVKKAIPDISPDTVNRTLLTFARIGLSHIVEGYGEVRRFDLDTETHHHFRCLRCSAIIDFKFEPYDRLVIPHHLERKFAVLKKKILLEGYCHKCRSDK